MDSVRVLCFFASYCIVLALGIRRFRSRSVGSRLVRLGVTGAGLLAHTAYLVNRSREANLPPLLSSTHDWLLVLAWLIALFYMFVSLVDRDLVLGIFMMPIVLILVGAAYYVNRDPHALLPQVAVQNAIRSWGMLHATLLVLGTTGVVFGFVLGLMYLAQHRRLKHHQAFLNSLRLPSLTTLARWNWWAVILSVPLLTFGLGTGIVLGILANRGEEQVFRFSDPQVMLSGLAWGVMMAFFVWLLKRKREGGRHVALLTIWAFGFLLATVLALALNSAEMFGSKSFHAGDTPQHAWGIAGGPDW